MKNIIIILTLFITSVVHSQYNLEFNRVLTFELAQNTYAEVPEGKVWKVESSTGQIRVSNPSNDIGYGISTMNSDTGAFNTNANATWLKSGDQLLNSTGGARQAYSIIEFNLISTSSTNSSSGLGSTLGLSFNRLIDFELDVVCSGNGGWECIAGAMQVPEGKLWQIVNVSNTRFNESGNLVDIMGGGPVYVGGTGVSNTSAEEGYFFNPGVYQIYVGPGSATLTTVRMKILEFNL